MSSDHPERDPRIGETRCAGVRWALWALGLFALSLGTLGIFLPLLPTTVFLLIALWAFSRSSPRFHRWLYDHPRLGPPLRAWHQHRVISPMAKCTAIGLMAGGLLFAAGVLQAETWALAISAAVLVPVAAFILSQRSAVPED
ncbi:MAG: YbaN family protein [Rhodanobacter sp.]